LYFELSDKLLSGTMFKLEAIANFRNYENGLTVDALDDDVKDAWICFLKDFCTLVSYEWHDYLKHVVNVETATFLGHLTTSDEAFTQWTICCKYQEATADMEEIQKAGRENWIRNHRKRKRGPHDSREKIQDYSIVYNKISLHRQNNVANQFWQQQFFQNYLKHKTNRQNETSAIPDDFNAASDIFRMPNLDGEIDGFDDEHVVAYSI
jgi:hypothetical protein